MIGYRWLTWLAAAGAVTGASNEAGGQEPVQRTVALPPLFDSDNVADSGLPTAPAVVASNALLTGDARFVASGPGFANPTLFFVDLDAGSVRRINAGELGLSDYGGIALVRVGTDGRLVAWHGDSSQIITMSLTGTVIRRIPLGLSSGFMAAPWELVAFDEVRGVAVLRQQALSLGLGNESEASYRQRVTFSLMRPGEGMERVVQTKGPETVRLTVRQDSARGSVETEVLFGETVFSTPFGHDKLIVAESDADSIWVLDVAGNYNPLMPAPLPSVVVSEADVQIERARRKRRLADDPETRSLIDMVSGRHREQLLELDRASRVAVDLAPVNWTPPAIADLVVDGQSRLWMKRFVPPTDSVALWEVWNTTRAVVDFRLHAPREWSVLDARDERVLFCAEGDGRLSGRGDVCRLMLVETSPASRQDH